MKWKIKKTTKISIMTWRTFYYDLKWMWYLKFPEHDLCIEKK